MSNDYPILHRYRMNSYLRGMQPGDEFRIEVFTDEGGVPVMHYWRRRLKDAETDNCITRIGKSKIVKKEVTK